MPLNKPLAAAAPRMSHTAQPQTQLQTRPTKPDHQPDLPTHSHDATRGCHGGPLAGGAIEGGVGGGSDTTSHPTSNPTSAIDPTPHPPTPHSAAQGGSGGGLHTTIHSTSNPTSDGCTEPRNAPYSMPIAALMGDAFLRQRPLPPPPPCPPSKCLDTLRPR